jgi:hypothetical protein
MQQRRWFLVPRREGRKIQRILHLAQPLVERLRQARVEGATSARSAGIKQWFEHPRRSS